MDDVLVTIVTPSYNQGRFIKETIDSVLNQSYQNIEYIVIDGGSTDNTLDILRTYGDQIIWISEPDQGQSDAINKGFAMANGEIVAWLNSDDTYELDAVELVVDYFRNHPEASFVYGEGYIIDGHSNTIKKFEATKEFDLWMLIHQWDYIMQPATFFKNEALKTIGYLDPTKNWTMDWDLWIRFAEKYELHFLPDHLANSREYEDTKTETGGFRRLDEILGIMRHYGEFKYPPGYFSYLGATIATLCKRIPILNYFSRVFAAFLHISSNRKLTGIYADGWISKYLFLAIPTYYRQVVIRFMPIGLNMNRGLLTVKKGRNCIERKKYGSEPFELVLLVNNSSKPFDFFSITAKHIFDMSKIMESTDYRNLSVRIVSIEKIMR